MATLGREPRISKMGYLYQQRVSERGKARDEAWKLYYSVLHGLTLRFYRDEEAEKDASYATAPPASLADPKLLTKAGFLEVNNCLLAIDYKSQRLSSQAPGSERRNIFSMTCQDMSEYRFQAANESAVITWVARIQKNLEDAGQGGDEEDEERDRVDTLDNMIKSRVSMESKNRKASLRTRNVLSLVRTPPRHDAASLAETTPPTTSKSPHSSSSSSPRKPGPVPSTTTSEAAADGDNGGIPALPDARLLCLHEQLHAREQLLEQLEREEEQFRGRDCAARMTSTAAIAADKATLNERAAATTTTTTPAKAKPSFTRCHFTTCIRQEYYLVPGYLSSAVSAGDEVTVFGRSAADGRWRCYFHRPGTAIMHCAASGKPGYDIKVIRDKAQPSTGGGGGTTALTTLPSSGTAATDGATAAVATEENHSPQKAQAPRLVLNPSLVGSVRRSEESGASPKADKKLRRDVEITTSATTKEYPMVGCLPTSILQGLGDAERRMADVRKWQRDQGTGKGRDEPTEFEKKRSSTSSQTSIPAAERIMTRIARQSSAPSSPEANGDASSSTATSPDVPFQLGDVLEFAAPCDRPLGTSDLSQSMRQQSITGSSVRRQGLVIHIGDGNSSDEGSDSERNGTAGLVAINEERTPGGNPDAAGGGDNGRNSLISERSISVQSDAPKPSLLQQDSLTSSTTSSMTSSMASSMTSSAGAMVSSSAPAAGSALDDDEVDFFTGSMPPGGGGGGKKKHDRKKQRSRSMATNPDDTPSGNRIFSRVTQFLGISRGDSFELASVSEPPKRKASTTSARMDRRGSSPNTRMDRRGSSPNTSLATIDGSGESPLAQRKPSSVSGYPAATAAVQPPLNELRTVRLTGFQKEAPGVELDEYDLPEENAAVAVATDNATDNGTDNTTDNGTDNTTDNGTDNGTDGQEGAEDQKPAAATSASSDARQVFISFIEPRSCAEKAGMVVGDAVLEVNGTSTTSLRVDDVYNLFAESGTVFLVKIRFTQGVRRQECQSRLKALTQRLKQKTEELERADALKTEVEQGEVDVATIQQNLETIGTFSNSSNYTKSVSTAGMSISEALWDNAMDGEVEGHRLRAATFSRHSRVSVPAEQSESSDDDDVITEEDAL